MFVTSLAARRRRARIAVLATPVVLCLGFSATAQTWTGAGTISSWTNAGNWTALPANNGTADLRFAGSTRLANSTGGSWSVNSIGFNPGAGAFNITGGFVTVGAGGIFNNSSSVQTLPPLSTSADQTWDVTVGDLVVNSVGNDLNLNHALTVVGVGTRKVQLFNTFVRGSGSITLKGGVLEFNASAIGAAFHTGGSFVDDGNMSLSGTGPTGHITVGNDSGAAGSALLTGSNTNTTGNTAPNATVKSDGAIRTTTVGAATLSFRDILMNGGSIANTGNAANKIVLRTLTIDSPAPVPVTAPLQFDTGFADNRVNVRDFANAVDLDLSSGVTGSFTKAGAGTLRVSNATSFSTGISEGTLILAGNHSTGTITLGGGTFQTEGGARTVGTLGVTAPSTLSTSHDLAVTAGVSGNAALTKDGTSALSIAGNSTGTGPLTLNAGTITLSGSTAFPQITNHTNLSVSAGSHTGVLSNSATLTGTGGAITGQLVNNGTFVSGGINFASALLSSGTMRLASGHAATGTIILNGGAIETDGGPRTIANGLSIVVPSVLDTAHDLTINGSLTGTAALIKSGPSALTLGGNSTHTGALTVNAGNVFFNGSTASQTTNFSTLTVNSGTHSGTVHNAVTLIHNGGTFTGRFINSGALILNAPNLSVGGFDNRANYTLPAGRTITTGNLGFENSGTFTLAGGTLASTGTGANVNRGTLNLSPHFPFNLNNGSFDNFGYLALNGANLNGPGTVFNGGSGLLAGPGAVTANFSNNGTIVVSPGNLLISQPFANVGNIQLAGPLSSLGGGTIDNLGRIRGAGTVANTVNNGGLIEATGGILVFSFPTTNFASGTVSASAGNTTFFTRGLTSSSGLIALSGGTLDNNNQHLTNTGQIAGYGTLYTGGLTNDGAVTLTGGFTSVHGPVTNNAGRTFRVQHNPALFTSPVVNNGNFVITNTNATFTQGLTGNAPSSAPASAASDGGPVAAAADAGAGTLTIEAGASVTATLIRQASVVNAGAITLRPAAQGGGASTIDSLTLLPGASLDMADNPVTILSTSPEVIAAYVRSGQLKATIVPDANDLYTVGYADTPAGAVVATTYYGDTDVDGDVDADDYFRIDRGFLTRSTGWGAGDFNHSGSVTLDDYLLIDRVFHQQSGAFPSAAFLADREAVFGAAYVEQLSASIPEPSCGALLVGALFPLARRRRGRRG